MLDSYDLEIKKAVKEINESKAKKVILQLPNGLKPHATRIASQIKKQTKAHVHIWLNSNFGACDVPVQLRKHNYDLLINFGHSK